MSVRRESRFLACAGLAALLAGGCGGGDDGEETTLFPANYEASYAQVRECRRSSDHDLRYVTVWADPAANGPYVERTDPFPTGAVVLKAEYDEADMSCSGEIIEWTVMSKLD